MDVHSTHVAIQSGASELNPRIHAILEEYGTMGFAAFKILLLGVVYAASGALLFLQARSRGFVAVLLAVSAVPAWLIAGSNYNEAGVLP